MADGSLVGTHQPPLEKGDDTVGARQQVFAFRLVPLYLSIMIIAGQIKIAGNPSVRTVLPGSMDWAIKSCMVARVRLGRRTQQAVTASFPNAPASRGRTLESLRPPKPKQILPARFVIGETLFQFHQCSRIILFHALTLYVGGGGVK
jgi:hypothetical protein